MQSNKISFKGQNIYVGIDVHLKTWHVTTLTESGCKYSFAQHADAKELFDRLNKKFPEAHFKSAYETGFCGFSVHYAPQRSLASRILWSTLVTFRRQVRRRQ